jgi:hypothetical protein
MPHKSDPEFPAEERQQIYEQLIAILDMNGVIINEHTRALMQPLLDGSMTREEHQKLLELLIHEQAHE